MCERREGAVQRVCEKFSAGLLWCLCLFLSIAKWTLVGPRPRYDLARRTRASARERVEPLLAIGRRRFLSACWQGTARELWWATAFLWMWS